MYLQIRTKEYYSPGRYLVNLTTPFDSSEQAWFWFMQANAARVDGARIIGGESIIPRPCEALDIVRIVDRLYRQRRLITDHIRVLAHYGRRLIAPDPFRFREVRASTLWREAMNMMDPIMRKKGIVQ